MARNEVVEEIDDALSGLGDAGEIIDCNAAARALLLPETADTVETPLVDLLPEMTDHRRHSAEADGGMATHTTVTDGTRTRYSVSVSTADEGETVAGYSVILWDVTAADAAG